MYISKRLLHVNFFLQIHMEEGWVHIHLIDLPFIWSGKGKNTSNGLHFWKQCPKFHYIKLLQLGNILWTNLALILSTLPFDSYLVRYTHLHLTSVLPFERVTRSQVLFTINEWCFSSTTTSKYRWFEASKKFYGSWFSKTWAKGKKDYWNW